MENCKKMRKCPHDENIDFLKSHGLCFSCLKQGHMAKTCSEKMSCEVCQFPHPTVLHLKNKAAASDEVKPTGEPSVEGGTSSVVSGCINADMRTCRATGAGNVSSILSIVPVYIRVKEGNKVLATYAFLDPGSNVTFCTEKLMASLNVTGRKTSILLKTMGDERLVSSQVVSGLEVRALDGDDYLELPNVYSSNAIPAQKQNIPLQEEVDKWPHLSRVQIPKIQAEVGLLIGTDVPKAMEPWLLVPSLEEGGPYAVRTRLGWIVGGSLRGDGGHEATSGLIQVTSNRASVAALDEKFAAMGEKDAIISQLQLSLEGKTKDMKGAEEHQTKVLEAQKLQRSLARQEQQLEELQQHKNRGDKALNEVQKQLRKLSGEVGQREAALEQQYQDLLTQTSRRLAGLEATVQRLTDSLAGKETQLQEYMNMVKDLENREPDRIAKGYAVKVPEEDLSRSNGILSNEIWIQGPDFLAKSGEEWPRSPDVPGDLTKGDPEVMNAVVNMTAAEEQSETSQRSLEYYVTQLQERQKWTRVSRNFAEGDVVLIIDDSAPGNSWVMGKIIEVVPDKHGLVRRVRIKTKTITLDRPITKVCLLQEAA